MKSSYEIVIKKGPQQGTVFPLERESLTIGRDPMSDIVINDPEISRHQARFVRAEGGGYLLEDLGSTNGTFIDGERLSGMPYVLGDGTEIWFGEAVMVEYQVSGDTPIDMPTDMDATMIATAMGQMPAKAEDLDHAVTTTDAEGIMALVREVKAQQSQEDEVVEVGGGMVDGAEVDVDSTMIEASGSGITASHTDAAESDDNRRTFGEIPAVSYEEPVPDLEAAPISSATMPSYSLPKKGGSSAPSMGQQPSVAYGGADPVQSTPLISANDGEGMLDGLFKDNKTRNIVIGVVIVMLLCCCCLLLLLVIGLILAADQGAFGTVFGVEQLAMVWELWRGVV